MGRPSQQDRRAVAAFVDDAGRLSLDAPRFDSAGRVRSLLGVDAVFTYEVGIGVDGPQTIGPRAAGAVPRTATAVRTFEGKAPNGGYTVSRPESAQRDRVLAFRSLERMVEDPGCVRGWFSGRTRAERDAALGRFLQYAEAWSHIEVFGLEQLRLLLCERGALLVYINAFHMGRHPVSAAYRLRCARAALRRRLVLERQLAQGDGDRLVLEAALDQLGRAAFVLGPRGQLLHANATGRLAHRDAMPRVLAAMRGKASDFQITRLGHAATTWYLAVDQRAEPSAAGRARAAAERWGLSAPQTRVLVGIAEGLSNKTIAAELGLAENTVEYHVTRILARVGVPPRAALIARVWIETA